MYIQTRSYDEIIQLAMTKSDMLSSIPAIQPIQNRELTRLASGFGMRIHPIYKGRRMHWGIDFSAPRGTPIYATGDGVITYAKVSYLKTGYGNQVEIDHGYGYKTLYGHMVRVKARVGQRVKRGEVIGYVGNSGKSTGPHLHYEVHKSGIPIDPINFFYNDLTPAQFDRLLKMAAANNQSLD